tara:strand:+ start:460 stop:867 length:408 start_codon:yes stop_codon:yes gene_type:complete
MLLYDGAPALGGADFTLDVELLVVVLLELDPDWYVVVAVEVYPPSIAVLDPDVLVCVDPANTAAVMHPDSSINSVINIIVFFINQLYFLYPRNTQILYTYDVCLHHMDLSVLFLIVLVYILPSNTHIQYQIVDPI